MAITITKPTVGGNEDTWGTTINTALDTIVDAVNGTSGTTAPNLSTLTINGTDVTATPAELNLLDGATAATSTTVVGTDRVVFNDGGTMKQVSMSDIATYTTSQVPSTTVNDATITITAGNALTGGGNFTTDQASNETITINHQDTSSQASVNNSGATYIQDITLDTYGHVTGITSTNVENNITTNGIVSAGNLNSTGGSSTIRTFNTGITVANGQTIYGWSTNETNNVVTWRDDYQGTPTTLGTNTYTNSTGSNVTVYGLCQTTSSNNRSIGYIIYG